MAKKNLVYIGSLRNAAADKAGQYINYQNQQRYMPSPLEHLVEILTNTELRTKYELVGIIYDDDKNLPSDQTKLKDYGFVPQADKQWFYPTNLSIHNKQLIELSHNVASSYRQYPLASDARIRGKQDFEAHLKTKLDELNADLVLLDGLLIILHDLIQPNSPYYRKIVNLHPGITAEDSPYKRRGAYATLDALYAAKGLKVVDWQSMQTTDIEPVNMTGASFHYVDSGIDSGEVIADVLATTINCEDSILEMRYNNFMQSLFPAMYQGLKKLAE